MGFRNTPFRDRSRTAASRIFSQPASAPQTAWIPWMTGSPNSSRRAMIACDEHGVIIPESAANSCWSLCENVLCSSMVVTDVAWNVRYETRTSVKSEPVKSEPGKSEPGQQASAQSGDRVLPAAAGHNNRDRPAVETQCGDRVRIPPGHALIPGAWMSRQPAVSPTTSGLLC